MPIKKTISFTDTPCTNSHIPNQTTVKIIRETKEGKNLIKAKDTEDLFKKLGLIEE